MPHHDTPLSLFLDNRAFAILSLRLDGDLPRLKLYFLFCRIVLFVFPTINGNVDLVRSEVKNFKALFQDAVTTIEEKNDQTKNKLLEAIDTNKKISFGIIVLVIIDIILRFI